MRKELVERISHLTTDEIGKLWLADDDFQFNGVSVSDLNHLDIHELKAFRESTKMHYVDFLSNALEQYYGSTEYAAYYGDDDTRAAVDWMASQPDKFKYPLIDYFTDFVAVKAKKSDLKELIDCGYTCIQVGQYVLITPPWLTRGGVIKYASRLIKYINE